RLNDRPHPGPLLRGEGEFFAVPLKIRATFHSCKYAQSVSRFSHLSRESVAKHFRVSGVAAQHFVAARRARPCGHGRKTLARLRAQIHRNTWRQCSYYRPVRCAANFSGRDLRLSRRLVNGSVGTTARVAGVQRRVRGRLHSGSRVAALAGAVARFISVSGLERAVAADNVRRRRHLARTAPAHDGHRRAIPGTPCADDARPAHRRLLLTRYGWTDGVKYALALCIVMSLLTAAFQWFMFEPEKNPITRTTTRTRTSFIEVVKSFTPALRELLVSDILIRFCERIPYAFVILWAIDRGGVTAQQFGYLVTFEMVTAMLCYIPVAHLADKYGRRPFVLITFVFFTLFPVTLLWAHNFAWLALAFVV